ncbi:MAG: primosomal protein N' [Oscillospiraceae bacterium]
MTKEIARVAVAAALYHIDRAYDYLIPESMEGKILPGVRVLVPFGRGNRPSEGIVLAQNRKEAEKQLKPILDILDPEPALSQEEIRLALWMRERWFCTVFDAVRTMLPAGLWYKLRYSYCLCPGGLEMAKRMRSEQAAEIAELIDSLGGFAELSDIRETLTCDPSETLGKMVKRGILKTYVRQERCGGGKEETVVSLKLPPEEAVELASNKRRRAPLQSDILMLLSQTGTISRKELLYFTGASSAALKSLEKQGLIELEKREVFRRPELGEVEKAEPINLTSPQKKCYMGLRALLGAAGPKAALLYGVTGSGKTSIYIKLIQDAVKKGEKALVLVPEISLTPQLVNLFAGHFGDRIAVLHSSLSLGERFDEYRRIKNGDVDVVVGTRSAVFAPLPDLGIIILDEEQEHTYKSESSPRYHARDVAKYRCAREEALLLLGSATPSIESFYAAKTGRYAYFELPDRYMGRPMPSVIISDMRRQLIENGECIFGEELLRELGANLEAGEQSILFVNRRGMSRMVLCTDCGRVPACPRCSVSLTYHAVTGRLLCHYCGYSEKLPEKCPDCGGTLRHVGFGTQRVEDELIRLFPGIRVMRMDADTVTATNSHEQILRKFGKGGADVLIGTQMVTKGLDFENVTLVGVLAADMSLYAEDFRASERTFSLITQVVGRSGRGEKAGRAIIQTFTPKNEVILLAAKQDYLGFYEREIELRSANGYPPFAEVFTVTASGISETSVHRTAARMGEVLSRWACAEGADMRILGPAPARIAKLNNRYRYRLTILCENNKQNRSLIGALIRDFSADSASRGVFIFGDLDPLE